MTTKYESENKRDEVQLETERYAAFSDGADEVVVYDTENHKAWLKCDTAVEIPEMV